MARILVAWELGGALGHIANVRGICESLLVDSHDVTVALRDASGTARIPLPEEVTVCTAPSAPMVPVTRPLYSHAEVLETNGYGDPGSLSPLVSGWRALMETVNPDLVIGDYAPTALTIARALGRATIAMGNPFSMPPQRDPLPAFQTPRQPLAEERAREHRVLATAAVAFANAGLTAPAALHDMFAADVRALLTFPELDPWRREPGDVVYWGPMAAPPGEPPDWPSVEGPKVFAYLHGFAALPALLKHLQVREGPTVAYIPVLSDLQRRKWSTGSLHLSARPVDVTAACRSADLAVCHSPHGTGLKALLHGCPLALVPLQVEQALNAGAYLRAGVAKVVMPIAGAALPSAVLGALEDAPLRAAARAFAGHHANHDGDTVHRALREATGC